MLYIICLTNQRTVKEFMIFRETNLFIQVQFRNNIN